MKLSRRMEGEARLVKSETLLRKSLLEVLPSVAESGRPLFFNSKYNPHKLPSHRLDAEAEALLELASACIDLRVYLALATEGSVGQLFIDACEENSSTNEHRRGPRRLAADLLEKLQ
jgi:hypothetical protein